MDARKSVQNNNRATFPAQRLSKTLFRREWEKCGLQHSSAVMPAAAAATQHSTFLQPRNKTQQKEMTERTEKWKSLKRIRGGEAGFSSFSLKLDPDQDWTRIYSEQRVGLNKKNNNNKITMKQIRAERKRREVKEIKHFKSQLEFNVRAKSSLDLV